MTGASPLAAWNCTVLVVLHANAERKQEQRGDVALLYVQRFLFRCVTGVACCAAHARKAGRRSRARLRERACVRA